MTYRLAFPREPGRLYHLAHWIATQLTFRMPALLWIRETGIWGSSENWHLYYRLRQSYADSRLLGEAPGHLFLAHEAEELASFLQVAMLNGWDADLFTEADYVSLFCSHDEFVEFHARDEQNMQAVRAAFPDAGAVNP